MSIQDVSKKINPVVNFWEKIYYRVKPYWSDRVIPLISKTKEHLDIKEDTFIVLAIILIGLAGFGLGKLSALEKSRGEVELKPASFIPITPLTNNTDKPLISTETVTAPMSASAMVAGENAKGLLVASKSGKKYHFPWCAGASQIAEKNKIWFDSYSEAQSAGYTPASNCPGLK